MLADCLAADRRFGITPVERQPELPGPELSAASPRYGSTRSCPTGGRIIVVMGGSRFVVVAPARRTPSLPCCDGSDLRRRYRAREPAAEDTAELRELFRRYVAACANSTTRVPEEPALPDDPSACPFILPSGIECDLGVKQRLLAERSTSQANQGADPAPSRAHQRGRAGLWKSTVSAHSNGKGGGDTRRHGSMNASLLTALSRIVGSRWVRHRRAELATYAMDGLPPMSPFPAWWSCPGDTGSGARDRRLLHLLQVPFVARGAGTGLSGGALAEPDAVLIALTRMNRILQCGPGAASRCASARGGECAAVRGGASAGPALRA